MFVDFERAMSEVFKTEILYLYLNLAYVLAHKTPNLRHVELFDKFNWKTIIS